MSVFWAHTPTKNYSSLVFPQELLSLACGFIIILLTSVHEEEEHYLFDARDDDDDDDDDGGGDVEGRFSLRERRVERDEDEEDYSSF